MESHDVIALDAEFETLRSRFNDKVIESYWNENGELIYILKEEVDLNEFAALAKRLFESVGDIEHDFIGKVSHVDQSHYVSFEYDCGIDHYLYNEDDSEENEYNTLFSFQEFWNADVSKKFNANKEVEFVVEGGTDLMKASKLIFNYINESTQLGQDITIILQNRSGDEERLLIPSNA